MTRDTVVHVRRSISALAVLLAACAAGPDYRAPATPRPMAFTATAMPDTLAAGRAGDRPQRLVDAAAAPPAWWALLGSPAIDALVDRAFLHNPNLLAMDAALRQAQELVAAQRGAYFPTVGVAYAAARAKTPDALASPLSSGASPYTLHTAQLSVNYVADVFGANRRSVESLQGQSDAQAWQLSAARLSLAANVVGAALQEASLREQLAATERLATIARQQLELLAVQQQLGAVAGAAVLAQDGLRQQADAAAAALRKQLAQQRDLLAVLVGDLPADRPAFAVSLSALQLPDVPVALPAQLVGHRPDVRAAEAQLRAANAQVGIAVSNMLPQITLSANYGAGAASLGQLFSAGGLMWGLGAGLVQPIFEGGSLQHRKLAAQAQYEAVLQQYQATVLVAFQNVADALEAARHDADQHRASVGQEAAASAALDVARRQQALGDIAAAAVLTAEAVQWQATTARIQAQAMRLGDVVALYQALGGSWAEGSSAAAASPAAP